MYKDRQTLVHCTPKSDGKVNYKRTITAATKSSLPESTTASSAASINDTISMTFTGKVPWLLTLVTLITISHISVWKDENSGDENDKILRPVLH